METLAAKCDLTDQGVRNQVKKLVKAGHIEVERSAGRKSNRYTVTPNSVEGSRMAPTPNNVEGKPPTPLGPTPNAVGPNHKEPSIEPSTFAPQAAPESEHQCFMRLWQAGYEKKFKRAYKFNGGRDGKAVKELLDEPGATADDLMDVVARAWRNTAGYWCQRLTDIHQLATHFNEIQFELNDETAARSRRPAADRPVGGNF